MNKTQSPPIVFAAVLLAALAASCKKTPEPPVSCFRRDGSACPFPGLDGGRRDIPVSDARSGELGGSSDGPDSMPSMDTQSNQLGRDGAVSESRPLDADLVLLDASTADRPEVAGSTGGVGGTSGTLATGGTTSTSGATGADAAASDASSTGDARDASADVKPGDASQDSRDLGGDLSSSDTWFAVDRADSSDDGVDGQASSSDAPAEGPPPTTDGAIDLPVADTPLINDGGIDASTTTCQAVAKAFQYDVSSIGGLSTSASGEPYVAVRLFGTVNLGSGAQTSAGGVDIALAKLDPASGAAVWTKTFNAGTGESTSPSDQIPAGVAVSSTGKLAVIGTFVSSLVYDPNTPGGTITGGADAFDFVMGTDASGNGKWGMKVDTQMGALVSIASHPARDEFVVCGYIMGPTTDLGLPGTSGGDNKEDVIIAKLSDTGSILWSHPFGGTGTQLCNAVALGPDGTVYATGLHNGAIDFGDGALPVRPASAQAIWVAKLDGTDGHALVSKSFGTSGKQVVNGIAVDAQGNVAIAGAVRNSLSFGTYKLTSAGGIDAYVAKLDASLVPKWATRWGDPPGAVANDQMAMSLSFTSTGDLVVVGNVNGAALFGSLTIPAAGATANAFRVKVGGDDGSALCASVYGNADYDEFLNAVSVSSAASGAMLDKAYLAGLGNGTFNVDGTTFSSTTAKGFLLVFP